MRRSSIVVLLPLLAFTACMTIGPNYERPTIEAPSTWRVEYGEAAAVANTRWWAEFGDPVLNELIETAVRENQDIRVAAARVDQFIGGLTSTRSQFYPQIGYGADVSRNRLSQHGATPVPGGVDPYYTLYRGALNADWQIDLFGRIRRETEAAQARVFASEQGRRGVILSVVASTAGSYVVLRALDRQLEIARATTKNYADTVELFGLRFKGGVVSQVEVAQAQSQYQQALGTIPSIEQQIAAQENLISILLGRNPGPILRGRPIEQLVAPGIPGDLPAMLLERRPDILQAEQNLVSANANIGVARSLYFPNFSLTGLLGSVSTAFSDFLSGPARTWSVVAGVAGPIFTFGDIRGQVQSAEAARREALAFYQQTILNAFRETNDALVGSQKKLEEATAQANRVIALRDFAQLSRHRFENGVASYLEVLYAENELFTAQLAAVRSSSERYTELINVYRAVGGGWVNEVEQLAPQPQLGVAASR